MTYKLLDIIQTINVLTRQAHQLMVIRSDITTGS